MARIRSIKPEFFRSERLSFVSRDARLTFAGLWVHADDEGRYRYSPKLLKADVFPYDEVTPASVDKWVQELARVKVVCQYEVNGDAYLHVVYFKEHQRPQHPTPSKLPECRKSSHGGLTEGSGSPHEDSGALTNPHPLDVDVVVVVDGEGEGEVQTIVEQARPIDDVTAVFHAWQASTGKARAKLDDNRRRTIRAALEAYPLNDVLDAVQGWQHDPWPERTQQNDLAQLLHMGTKRKPVNVLERMRDLQREGPPPIMGPATARAAETYRQMQAMGENGGVAGVDRDRRQAQRQIPRPAD